MGKLRPCVSVDIKDSSDRHHHQEIQFLKSLLQPAFVPPW